MLKACFATSLLFGIALVVGPTPASAQSTNAALHRAEVLIEGLRYADAEQVLQRALAAEGNSREALTRCLELLGIVSASLNRPERARAYFRMLTAIDPGHALSESYAPRIMTPFAEAKAWSAAHQPLVFESLPPEVEAEAVRKLAVVLKRDALGLARAVRFNYRPRANGNIPASARAWRVQTLSTKVGTVELSFAAAMPPLEYWVELLGERGELLRTLGAPKSPLLAPLPTLVPPTVSQPVVMISPPSQVPVVLRRTSYGVASGAVALVAAGGAFGFLSWRDRQQLAEAPRDASGRITSLSQQEGFALDAAAASRARVANGLFIGAGALALAAIVLFAAGGDPPELSPPAGAKP